MNSVRQLIDTMTPDIYQKLKQAVELGKWPNGKALSQQQRGLRLQAVIAYEERLPESERTGYIPFNKPAHCGGTQSSAADDDDDRQALTFNSE